MDTQIDVVPSEDEFQSAVGMLKLLGDETRLRIIWALLDGEHSVNELAALVGAHPTGVSQHLAKLRLARLVRTRRDGTRIYYVADDAHVRRLVEEVLSHADHVTRAEPVAPGPGAPRTGRSRDNDPDVGHGGDHGQRAAHGEHVPANALAAHDNHDAPAHDTRPRPRPHPRRLGGGRSQVPDHHSRPPHRLHGVRGGHGVPLAFIGAARRRRAHARRRRCDRGIPGRAPAGGSTRDGLAHVRHEAGRDPGGRRQRDHAAGCLGVGHVRVHRASGPPRQRCTAQR